VQTYERSQTKIRNPEIGFVYSPYKIKINDLNKSVNGPVKSEIVYPKGYKHDRFKAEKGKAYNKQPVVLVFKTSNRSNAQTKMKIFANENIDYIMSADKLVGVPETAIILECGVGDSFIESYKLKYSL